MLIPSSVSPSYSSRNQTVSFHRDVDNDKHVTFLATGVSGETKGNIKVRKAVILYGCETWSLTLRKERRLRVFENRVLRNIFGPKRDEITREWRKLHNEELNLYCSANILRVIKSRRMR